MKLRNAFVCARKDLNTWPIGHGRVLGAYF
jgi:hypothetical protein